MRLRRAIPRPRSCLCCQWRVHVVLGSYRLDETVKQRVEAPLPGADLSKHGYGNQQRTVEPPLKQLQISHEQPWACGQRTDRPAVKQEVSAMAAGHSGQVSARA